MSQQLDVKVDGCIQVPISSKQSQRPVDHGAGIELTAVTATSGGCGSTGGGVCIIFSSAVGGSMERKIGDES